MISTTNEAGSKKDEENQQCSENAQIESNQLQESISKPANSEVNDADKQILKDIYEKVTKLFMLFKEKIEKDETKDSLFKILNSKLDMYEQDFIFKHIKKRLFSDVILLYDRVEMLKKAADEGQLDPDKFGSALYSFSNEILQLLKRQGVKLLQTDSNKFNEEYQEAIATKPTDSKEHDQNVIEVVRKGFIYDEDLLLRPEEVIVAKYEPKKEGGINHG